jgi:hypothetical protein
MKQMLAFLDRIYKIDKILAKNYPVNPVNPVNPVQETQMRLP